MLVLVCGSRDWDDPTAIKHRLFLLHKKYGGQLEIIHGGARGADQVAAMYARAMGIPEHSYPAKWREQGRAAGVLRNLEMLEQHPDLVVAFWDGSSTGTLHTITAARERKIQVEIVEPRR